MTPPTPPTASEEISRTVLPPHLCHVQPVIEIDGFPFLASIFKDTLQCTLLNVSVRKAMAGNPAMADDSKKVCAVLEALDLNHLLTWERPAQPSETDLECDIDLA